MSSTSEGISLDDKTRGASCVDPLVPGRNCFEKLSKASINKVTEASSPSQSLLVSAWNIGCAKNPCVPENPIILPTTAAEVWGANTLTRAPAISLADKYDLPLYLKQTLELTKRNVESVFGKEKEKQEGLGRWFG